MDQRQRYHQKIWRLELHPPMCLQRLIRSTGKLKRQNSKLEKSRMAGNKLPRESQIFATIWKNVYVMVT